jgi:DNA-binding HxlR family transcriptional regulator
MPRTSFANWPCSFARALDLFGDPWVPLILREAFYGMRRFDEFQQELKLARNTLADRLRLLVEHELMVKQPYQDDPVRHDYVLTESGRDFFPVMLAMTTWGDRWLAGEGGRPIDVHHNACGHDTTAEVVCAHCHRPMQWSDTSMKLGSGYPPKLAARPDIRRRFAG